MELGCLFASYCLSARCSLFDFMVKVMNQVGRAEIIFSGVMGMNESNFKCSSANVCVCACAGEEEEGVCLCVFMDFCCFLVLRVLSYVSHLCRLSEQPGYVFVGDCACLPPSLCNTHTQTHTRTFSPS